MDADCSQHARNRLRHWALLTVAGAVLAGALARGSRAQEGPAAEWGGFTVDRVGWVGIEELCENAPEEAAQLLPASGVHLLPTQDPSHFYLLYYPTSRGLTKELDTGATLADIYLVGDEKAIMNKSLIDTGLLFGTGPDMQVTDAGPAQHVSQHRTAPAFWYVHPFRGDLVRYSVRTGNRETWDLSDRFSSLLEHSSLNSSTVRFGVDEKGHTAQFAFIKRHGGMYYGRYDLRTARWTEQEVGPAIPMSIGVLGSDVCIVARGEGNELWDYRAPAEDSTRPGAPGDVPAAWTSVRIDGATADSTARVFRDGEGALHVIQGIGHSVRHFQFDGKDWRAEVVREASGDRAGPEDLYPAHMAIGVAVAEDGAIHLSCFDPKAGEVQHVWQGVGGWSVEKTAQAQSVYHTAVMAARGRIAVAYIERPSGEVRVSFKKLEETGHEEPEQQ